MKIRKRLYIAIGICLLAFFLVIAYWTVLPRQGTVKIPGEGFYTGELRGMTFHGYGTYESYAVGGTSYEGEWKDGVYHGQGTLTFANGSQVTGEFKHGSLHGQGQAICPEGHVREVDFGEAVEIESCSSCGHEH